MKKLLCVLLASLMLLSIVGCTQQPVADVPSNETQEATKPTESENSAENTTGEKRVLRVAAESWQVTKIFLEEAAAEFEKAHPDVDVEIITMADTSVMTTYSLDWTNGTTDVDLVFCNGITFANQFASQDLIYDFDADLHFFDNFDENEMINGVLDYGKIDGRQVLLPIIFEVYGLCINKQMFKEAGLVDANGDPLPIKTWDDVYEYAKKLTVYDADGKLVQQGFMMQLPDNTVAGISGLIISSQGQLFEEDGITINYDTEELAYILDNWKKGIRDGYYSSEGISDGLAPRNNYKAGNAAMIYEAAGRWMEAAPLLGEENLGVVDMPGGKGTYGFTNGVLCPKVSPNADLAVLFIQEQLLGEYVQTNTLSQHGKLPVINSYYLAEVEANPIWGGIEESMKNAITNPAYKDIGKLTDGLLNIMAEGLLDDSISGDDMVKEMADLIDSIEK